MRDSKLLLHTFLLFMLPFIGAGQSNNNEYLHNRYVLERIGTNGAGLESSSIPTTFSTPPEVKGDVYLNKSYDYIVFQLYEGDRVVEGYMAKLDLKLNEFDVITPQGVKALKGNLVKSFIFADSLTRIQTNYVNAREWRSESNPAFDGFFEILVEGNLTLVKRTGITMLKPDFNPALNVGSKDYRILKKEELYYIDDGKVLEVPGKRNFAKIFTGKEKEIQNYITEKNLSVSRTKDVVKVFTFYKSLTK